MKIKDNVIFAIVLFILWQCISICIGNNIILPQPFEVFFSMLIQFFSPFFFPTISMTVFRVLFSLFISFFCAIILVFVLFKNRKLSIYFDQFLLIIRSLPNVTIILLLLFWLNREVSVITVCFLLLFPMIYQNLKESLSSIYDEWKDVIRMNPQPFFPLIRYVYLPLMVTSIKASLINGSSLGFKVGIMAEILSQVPVGMGRQIQFARLDIDLAGMMGWTIWLLIFVFIFDYLFKKFINRIFR